MPPSKKVLDIFAEWQRAEDLARQNAVNMLGLPEDNTAAQRALAMGFDTPAYHGTMNDFDAFDLSKAGKNDEGYLGSGVYVGSPVFGNVYAGAYKNAQGGRVMPLTVRQESPLELSARFEDGREIDRAITTRDALGLDVSAPSQDVTSAAIDKGYDSVNYDYKGDVERAIFDPSNIRSRFAHFDPARRNEADLLAGFAPLNAEGNPNLLSEEEYSQLSEEGRKQALRKIMAGSVPNNIGDADLGKSLDVLNRGAIAGTLGAPVDLVSMLLGPFGYNVEKPVGGSEWIGQQMQDAGMVSDKRYPAEELLAGLVNPIPAGIFAGKGAKMADVAKLALAEKLLDAGDDAADVWRATGWGKGPDGKWRFEIPDNEAAFTDDVVKQLRNNNGKKQSTIFNHDELYSQYPEAADIWTAAEKGDKYGASGNYSSGVMGKSDMISLGIPGRGGVDLDEFKGTNLHELQHAIQEREGFARGGSPGQGADAVFDFDAPAVKALLAKQKEIESLMEKTPYWDDAINDRNPAFRNLQTELYNLERQAEGEAAMQGYRRLAGEAESRLTQSRMNLTPQERLLQYPYEPEYFEQATGVPIDRLIYRGVSPDTSLNLSEKSINFSDMETQPKFPDWFSPPKSNDVVDALANHALFGLKHRPRSTHIIGSFAGGQPNDASDIDILLEIPKVRGRTAEDITEAYRNKIREYFVKNNIMGIDNSVHPQLDGRRLDVYFTYDAGAEGRPKIKLE